MKNKNQHSSQSSHITLQIQKCAYHSKQYITNFCKCQECLLPVCPTCIKVHIDQHKVHKTNPQFEEINRVIKEIRSCYEKLTENAEGIRRLLTEIQQSKKEKEKIIRKTLLDNRNVLIKEFERRLIEMENRFIDEIVKDDQEFVKSMSQLDDQLTKIEGSIKRSEQNLNNDDLLKHVIIFFGKKSDQKYSRELEYIKSRSRLLTKKHIEVRIDQKQLDVISQAVERYMTMEIIDTQSETQR